MPVTDPIADMLTRIRNGLAVRQEVVSLPTSRMKAALARILREEGFIRDYEVVSDESPQGTLRIRLHYREKGEPGINGLKRVSKPGLRVYAGRGEIPRPYGGLGIAVVSTSAGVMTGRNAWRRGVGGEVLCYIW